VAAGTLCMHYYELLSMTATIVLVGSMPHFGAGPPNGFIATALR
jgi:hypothetical protein